MIITIFTFTLLTFQSLCYLWYIKKKKKKKPFSFLPHLFHFVWIIFLFLFFRSVQSFKCIINRKKRIYGTYKISPQFLLWIWLTLTSKMAHPDLRFLQFYSDFCFHQPITVSGSQIINCKIVVFATITSLFCFLHQLCFLSEQPWNSLSFIWGCSDGMQHISEGSKYKSNCRKNSNYNKSFGCQGERVDHCGIAKSILWLSSSKNEGGCVRLCQNSVAFMLQEVY